MYPLLANRCRRRRFPAIHYTRFTGKTRAKQRQTNRNGRRSERRPLTPPAVSLICRPCPGRAARNRTAPVSRWAWRTRRAGRPTWPTGPRTATSPRNQITAMIQVCQVQMKLYRYEGVCEGEKGLGKRSVLAMRSHLKAIVSSNQV